MGVKMIITCAKPYGVVKGMLKKWKKIGIVSCNSCARACETGGKEKMEELANRLKSDGFDVVDMELVPMACNIDAVKKPEYHADYLVVLACDSGVFSIQSLFPNKIAIPALDTVGLGARDSQGNIFLMKKF
jgi:transcription elongation factor Elf1